MKEDEIEEGEILDAAAVMDVDADSLASLALVYPSPLHNHAPLGKIFCSFVFSVVS
jgi:hypothetical protein